MNTRGTAARTSLAAIASVTLAGTLAMGSATALTAQAAPTAAAAPTVAAQVAGPAQTPARASKPKPRADAPGTAFTAYGPTWRATVKRGVLRFDGRRVGSHTTKVERLAFAKGVEFTGRHHGRPVALVVRSGKCIDSSGQDTGMRATLSYGTRTLRGCAVAGATPIANT